MFFSLFLFLFLVWPNRVLAAPPAGFQTLNIVSTGLEAPTTLDIAPDGRIFILEQSGKIKVYKNQTLLTRVFAEISVNNVGERGLLGMAFDPDFSTNHFAYFHYIDASGFHRVVRYDASADFATSSPVDIYKSPTATQNIIHKGGTIQFGSDGKLYLSIGDDYNGSNSQNLANPFGKILRLNKDGTVPLDNPYVNDPGKLPQIYAYGFRNPFRFQFDQNGKLYLGDVGEATWEEVNLVTKGGNYGWPSCEGSCNTAGFTNPIYSYNHNGQGASITGGFVYEGTAFPSDYRGNYFFGDYVLGDIYSLVFNSDGSVQSQQNFDLESNSAVDFREAPDGSVYYVTIYPPALKRIVYNSGNSYPEAKVTAAPTQGVSPLAVSFSSAGSFDPENTPLNYLWNFGDGSTSTNPNPSHTYNQNGRYIAQLTVSDGSNSVKSSPLTIDVGLPPEIVVNSPTDNSKYNAGQTIAYSVTSDGDLTTEIIFHHNTHSHPFLGPLPGGVGEFVVPNTGETATDVWYEIIFEATSDEGITASKFVEIHPNLSSYTLATVPSGLQVLVNSQPTDEVSVDSVVGMKTTLDVRSQVLNGTPYEFDHWSDNSPKSRTIITSVDPVTYTAHFRQIPPYSTQFFNNTALSGAPIFSTNYPEINFGWGGGSPNPVVNFNQFSGRFTKSQTFAAGHYTFSAGSDDGLRLYIDGNLLIDKWVNRGFTLDTAGIDLSAGSHAIVLEYYENTGDAALSLTWDYVPVTVTPTPTTLPPTPTPTTVAATPIPTSVPSAAYHVDYYNNTSLSSPVVASADEAVFFHDWGNSSPAAGVNPDNFSARAVRTVNFANGLHRFIITADDGVRFYIDDKLVLDKWIDEPPTRYTFDRMLSGIHTLRLEYYERGGGAVAKLGFQKIADSVTPGFLAEYYPNRTLTGVPYITRYDPTIQFNWGSGSPGASIPSDNFSSRWTQVKNYESGNYRFSIVIDDGARIYLDNNLIFDRWIDQQPTNYIFDLPLSAGEHTISIEYYENGGWAFAEFNLTKL